MKKFAAALLVGAISLAAGGVSAAEDLCEESPQECLRDVEVKSTTLTPDPLPPAGPSIAAPTPSVSQQTQLPVTGGDAATLAIIGGGLVLGGAVLVRSRKLVAVKAD